MAKPDHSKARLEARRSTIDASREFVNIRTRLFSLKHDCERAAFAHEWLHANGLRFANHWVTTYELLDLCRTHETYKDAEATSDEGGPFASFEEFFEKVASAPFRKFAELEETYHFAEIATGNYQDLPLDQVRESSEFNRWQKAGRVKQEVEKLREKIESKEITQKEAAEMVGVDRSRVSQIVNESRLDRLSFTPEKSETAIQEARRTGRHKDTILMQRKIAAEHPDLHKQVESKEITVTAAARKAGIIKTKTAYDHLMSWWKKASLKERKKFMKDKDEALDV